MIGLGKFPTCRDSSDSATLDNGVVPCVEETQFPKRLKKDSHPRAAPSPSINFLRGAKTRGRNEAGKLGGGCSVCQV